MENSAIKKVTFNITERLKVIRLLNDFKGSLDKVAIILEDIKQFPVSEAEWKEVEGSIKINGTTTSYSWKKEKEKPVEFELQKVTVDYLKKTIEERDEKGEFGVEDLCVRDILEKISA